MMRPIGQSKAPMRKERGVDTIDKEDGMPEEGAAAERTPSGIMLASMLLLIAGFLLTGILFLAHAPKRSAHGLARPVAQGRSFFDALRRPPKAAPAAEDEGPADPKPPPKRPPDKVKWPKLKLTGFGSSTGGTGGFAIINGKQIHPEQTVEGVTLREIRAHDVVVEYMGERRTLTVEARD